MIIYPETLKTIQETVGKNIRRLRMKRDLYQKELGEIFGVSSTTIYAIEKGIWCPCVRNLLVLANLLQVDINEFFKPCEKMSRYTVRKKRIVGQVRLRRGNVQ